MNNRHRGFLLADTIMGLIILAILGVVFAKAVSLQQHSSQRLADTRVASRYAEQTLLELRQGHTPPPFGVNQTVRVEPAVGSSDIGNFVWVRVTSSCNHSSVTLFGLASRQAMEKH